MIHSLALSVRTGTLHTTWIKIMIKGYTLPKMKADPSSAPCYKLYPRQMEGQATPLHYSARPGEFLLGMLSGILEKMYLWSLYNIMWIWQSQRETRQRPCFAARAYRSEFMRMDIEAYVHTHIHRHTHTEQGHSSPADQWALCRTVACDLGRRCLNHTVIPRSYTNLPVIWIKRSICFLIYCDNTQWPH